MSTFPMALLGSASAILAIVCLFAALLIVSRTRSTHVITFRLWRLINGNRPISDPSIRVLVDDQSSLMAFRFVSGLRVASLDRANALVDEIRERKIDVSDLRLARRFIDISGPRLGLGRIPTPVERLIAFVLSVALCAAGTIAICGVFY